MGKRESQVEKFKKAARDHETDDNEKHFNEKLGKIARAKAPSKRARKKAPSK
jgi:hypothetical protein